MYSLIQLSLLGIIIFTHKYYHPRTGQNGTIGQHSRDQLRLHILERTELGLRRAGGKERRAWGLDRESSLYYILEHMGYWNWSYRAGGQERRARQVSAFQRICRHMR